MLNALKTAAVIDSEAVLETPPPEAVIFTNSALFTPVVLIANVALVAPEGTVTLVGTEA
jgi:hypothetical protein